MTMELRELAERILFGTTLEDKLSCPATITDHRPGAGIVAPDVPARPAELLFKSRGSRGGEFPGVHRLENESERGRLLHFFANHELLATELMALALLRFPDAPAAFRRGLLQTLRDEQEHTRLYLERMRTCGIAFGDVPVSGYFWRAVSGMEHPIDYVAGLSLTFEQANLDFARHFARNFSVVGDVESAALLDRIYRDEIGHVAYGLKWFRRWKNPGASDWEAYCRQLKFPLSPARAKGSSWNPEGRRAAGLEPAFIEQLRVFSQSKGRTPGVFVFNPFVEDRIARGPGFTPGRRQAQLARDLANLPQYLGRRDDIVLVPQRPSVSFLESLQRAGLPLLEYVELHHGRIAPDGNLPGRKVGALRPWAWGPDSVELFEPLFGAVSGRGQTPESSFNSKLASLYSKEWSAAFLREVLGRVGPRPWLCSDDEVGVAATSVGDAVAAIAAIRRCGHHRVVVKEAFGFAGHNMLRLWEPELLDTQRRWIENVTSAGRTVVIEPWLERVMDFSIQLERTDGGLALIGYTGLVNDQRGQFVANWADSTSPRRIPGDLPPAFAKALRAPGELYRIYGDIIKLLDAELRGRDFRGPIGIDAFIYRAVTGELRLKPVVEINPRCTMGRVTLELMRHVCPGATGVFEILNRARLRREGFQDFGAYGMRMGKQWPVTLEGSPMPRIREGALCLNDPAQAREFLAVFRVARTMAAALTS
jgi:uncharacterized ferritin-like protein (DUF455 family)